MSDGLVRTPLYLLDNLLPHLWLIMSCASSAIYATLD
jgi:hypothetical protein